MAEKIGICSDHGGRELKRLIEEFLKLTDYELIDYGISYDNQQSVDYPDYAELLATDVSSGRLSKGIAICGTGIGMSIAANKFPNVRAAIVTCQFTAVMSRLHNNSNVICLGARVINHHRAVDYCKLWLDTDYEAGRHEQRLSKMRNIEQKNFRPRG
jgi:ribose 5-phosphate isomerase B